MQEALKYKKKSLADKKGDLFLTVDSLITLNNIITVSQNIGLRDVNIYPAGYSSKMYMDKRYIENALYRLVDQFNDRLISHKDFCETFSNQIHPFRDENDKTCKILFVNQINNI